MRFYRSKIRSDPEELALKRREIANKGFLHHLMNELKHRYPNGFNCVVDVGGGSGTNLTLVNEILRIDLAISTDLNPRPAHPSHPQMVCADAAHLPFRSGSIAALLLIEVIEHLIDPDEAIVEFRRVLEYDGKLVMSTPNLACLFNRILLPLGYQPLFTEVSTQRIFGRPGTDVVGHLRIFTFTSLQQFMRFHRFRTERILTTSLTMNGILGRIAGFVERIGIAISPSLGSRIIAICAKEV